MSHRSHTTIPSLAAAMLGLLLVSCGSVNGQIDEEKTRGDQGPKLSQFAALPRGVTFEVVSVREMNSEESLERTPGDVIGLDVAVRLRLSTDEIGIRIWNPFDYDGVLPICRMVVVEDGIPVPLPSLGNFGGESRTSWILPPHSALEWESFDSIACDAAVRAFTVFLVSGSDDEVIEVVSEPYEALLAPEDHWKCNFKLDIRDPEAETRSLTKQSSGP